MTDLKSQLAEWLSAGLARVAPECAPQIALERPKQPQYGDYSSNVALQLAKTLKRNPRELAAALIAALEPSPRVARVEMAGAGFINLFLSDTARREVIARILDQGDAFGSVAAAEGTSAIVEFVSANPTGPLHVGHGRAAAVGDAISRLVESQGYRVHREYYYNDAGAQIVNLALSVQARVREAAGASAPFPAEGYQGEYVREIARAYLTEHPDDDAGDDLDTMRSFAVATMRREQDADLSAFGVRFDQYFLESSLYSDGLVDKTVRALTATGRAYEQDGALWLKTTDYGDDKDRVMRKSDGSYTYFVPDIAYHVTKWERGFKRAITELGADHAGSLSRVRAGLQALDLGIPAGYPEYVLHQMVLVMRGGEEVKLSKRAGTTLTLRELIDEVGRDAVRFFFLLRKSDSQLTFDIDLARAQSEENPVYYVQYAHARVCSVLEKAGISPEGAADSLRNVDLSPLSSAYESALLRRLADFTDELAMATRELAPHLITFYLKELAAEFHSYYNAEQFLVDDDALRQARLALVVATGQVVRNGLAVLGVSAPVRM
ncbi:MAG: arginine--tRNA ligase [Betaproteobacteria bacterium]|nr:MAG: arginine--tRNA ligase [Betaproteobacteria bacterium]TMH17182.1 MAG: arginine--tRNA ligase [Betaproteobacteria bacterium]